ncbi:hypothetical protein ACIQ1D_18805 [Lysinibacillus xylanilyticus]|uniref:hypothetical protein n=1 Tax=Lysinibacillus xylanilyticus TaxID=582475 RepID=UPI00381F724E
MSMNKEQIREIFNNKGLMGALSAFINELPNGFIEARREDFFNSLTANQREAHKLLFQMIENKYKTLKASDDKEVRENWSTQFIDYHDDMLVLLKESLELDSEEKIFSYATNNWSMEFNAFQQDTRTLQEVIRAVGKAHKDAEMHQKGVDSEMQTKLKNQLLAVVETLEEITANKPADVKNFEIHIGRAMFDITLHNAQDGQCTCGQCDNGLPDDLEDLVQRLKNRI